jgi:hypothetical protein
LGAVVAAVAVLAVGWPKQPSCTVEVVVEAAVVDEAVAGPAHTRRRVMLSLNRSSSQPSHRGLRNVSTICHPLPSLLPPSE